MSDMTKAERDELARLVRRREKLAKADADQVAAERLANFEEQMAMIYRPSDDPVWQELRDSAEAFVAEVDERLAARCRELGVLEKFRPKIGQYWQRGENASKERRAELRAVAKTRIDAEAKAAKRAIERSSLDVQTELVAGGLVTEDAQRFLAAMPSAEALMPAAPSVAEIEDALRPGQLAVGQ